MKKTNISLPAVVIIAIIGGLAMTTPVNIKGCTSAIALAKATKHGRPLLWKNRDTGTEHNFIARVPATNDTFAYVALYNGGDSLLREAWAGCNEAGFGVMNTASYNLAPDTAKYKDREADVMTLALKKCRTVDDFAKLLDTLPKPMGVQANFGVIDAEGNGAYFETDDYTFKRFNADDNPNGVLIRTNFSVSGNETDGMGYIRCDNAGYLLKEDIESATLTPASFTENCSRSFYHSLLGHDFALGDERWVIDQDFIPRHSTSATVVIEGISKGESPALTMMWVGIGYPPCSFVLPVFIDEVPEELLPRGSEWRSPLCDRALERKAAAFPIKRGSGKHYIDMKYLRDIDKTMRQKSTENYIKGYIKRKNKLESDSKL